MTIEVQSSGQSQIKRKQIKMKQAYAQEGDETQISLNTQPTNASSDQQNMLKSGSHVP
jgi:hypothetical protein